MQAKLDGWQFPRIQCRNNHTGRFCCAGVAAPTGIQRDDDGQVIVVDYRCEFGHGWFMVVDDGMVRDLDADRIVQGDRAIEERWACRQCTNDRGNPKLLIWPVSTAICPVCEQGTRYTCLDCGEQLRRDQRVHETDEGFLCDGCLIERHTVPASDPRSRIPAR